MYAPIETTPLHIVSTLAALGEMMSVLERADEIAIDLEHHDYRSFLGHFPRLPARDFPLTTLSL